MAAAKRRDSRSSEIPNRVRARRRVGVQKPQFVSSPDMSDAEFDRLCARQIARLIRKAKAALDETVEAFPAPRGVA